MASDGPRYPGTTASEAGPSGDNDWISTSPIGADDGSEAQITAATFDAGDHSFRLKATNFGFDAGVPAGSSIDGIVVEIDRRDFAGDAQDQEVRLYDSTGTLVGDDKQTATSWPTTSAVASYGSSTDTWNAGLDADDIRSAGFGVALIALANSANTDIGVDFIRVTVHYTAPENHDGGFSGSGGGTVVAGGQKGAEVGIAGAGGGTASASAQKDTAVGLAATGGGTASAGETTDRGQSFTATGGGVLVWDYDVESGEDHSGDFAATGGGVLDVTQITARDVSLEGTGGGELTIVANADRTVGLTATGGGIVSVVASSDRYLDLAGVGGGSFDVGTTHSRLVAPLMSGGGVIAIAQSSERHGDFVATGSGTGEFAGSQAEDHSGGFTATGGGAANLVVSTDRLASVVAVGGGAFLPVQATDRLVGFAATGGGVVVWGVATDQAPVDLAAVLVGLTVAGAIAGLTGGSGDLLGLEVDA